MCVGGGGIFLLFVHVCVCARACVSLKAMKIEVPAWLISVRAANALPLACVSDGEGERMSGQQSEG